MYVQLHTGQQMPAIGLGTWQANDEELGEAVETALEAGYRHIDTAAVYENEEVIGKVLNKWLTAGKLKREDLFITTKLPPSGNRPSGVAKYIKESLKKLQLDYLDLYLVHAPFGFQEGEELHPFSEDGTILLDTATDHIAIWKAMELQVASGLTKAIGLSNFNEKQIKRILDNCEINPANLQVELHLYFQQRSLLDFCQKNGITVTAYSPLGSRGSEKLFNALGISKELPNLMNHPEVLKIAESHGKSATQVLLRHILQKGCATIPKSTSANHIKKNINVFDFELSEGNMATLNGLDQGPERRIVDFSFFKGLSEHPEFPF